MQKIRTFFILAALIFIAGPAAATRVAIPPRAHSVSLSWRASASDWTQGGTAIYLTYLVYRGTASGGPYTLVGSTGGRGTSWEDDSVTAGGTYYYVVTAYNGDPKLHLSTDESGYSNEVMAVVPTP